MGKRWDVPRGEDRPPAERSDSDGLVADSCIDSQKSALVQKVVVQFLRI